MDRLKLPTWNVRGVAKRKKEELNRKNIIIVKDGSSRSRFADSGNCTRGEAPYLEPCLGYLWDLLSVCSNVRLLKIGLISAVKENQ